NFYRLHTGHPLGGAGVDAHDFRVRIGTTEHLAIEHAGTMDIVGILRLSRDFDGRIEPGDALADQGAVLLIVPWVVRAALCFVLCFDSKDRTGVYRLVLHHHGTATAFGAIADTLGASEFELIPQSVQQSNTRFETRLVHLAVDRKLHRDFTRAIHWHLLARSHDGLGAGDQRNRH